MAGYIEQIAISERRSKGYIKWIQDGAKRLKESLPFEGHADFAITLGSGLGPVVNHLSPTYSKTIKYERIGLPVGKVPGHKKEIIGALMANGKKIIIINGRTHAYEIPEEGVVTEHKKDGKTEVGIKLSRMELATGYLAMLNQIGVENMILTNAVGGINHPLRWFQPKPFKQENLPTIGVVASAVNEAYESPQMGPYKGFASARFVNSKNSDPELSEHFRQSMYETAGKTIKVPYLHYITSRSTPLFESPEDIWTAAINGGQAVGMTYSYEKDYLSGAIGIGRFIDLAIITNSQELIYKSKTSPEKRAISVEELRKHYPHEFKLASQASHKEVEEYGAKAVDVLGKALTHLIKSV